MRIASIADMRSPFDYAAPPLLRVTQKKKEEARIMRASFS